MAKAGTKPKKLTMKQKNAIAAYVTANAGAQATGQPDVARAKAIYGTKMVRNPYDKTGKAKKVPAYALHLSGRQIYNDPAELARVLAGTGQGKTVDELLRNISQGYESAGVEQARLNLSGKGDVVRHNPFLQNVDPNFDVNSLLTVLGQANAMELAGNSAALANIWKQRMGTTQEVGGGTYQGVPAGAAAAFDTLTGGGSDLIGQIRKAEKTGGGLGFDLSQVVSPGINLYDPSKPFFDMASGDATSLQQLGSNQAGERAMLASLSLEEYLKQIQPLYNAQFNRGPGAPAPYAGLTFGSEGGGEMRNTDAYRRWAALGMPGDPTSRGWVYDAKGAYQPLTGQGALSDYAKGRLRNLPGQASYLGDPSLYPQLVMNQLGRIGAAGYLGDPSLYFAGPFAGYNPADMDPNTLARLLALLQTTPTGPPAGFS